MKLRGDLSLTETVEGGFLLDKRTGDCFALNKVGLDVWRRLGTGTSQDEILTSLSSQYGTVPRETLLADLSSFMTEITQRKLTVD